jgi:urease accessory protein
MNQMALRRRAHSGHALAPIDASARTWRARLELGLERRGAQTALVHRRHQGPLRVQKTLYPEGPELAHLILIHPPAGIAGGDHLEIDAHLGDASHALITTPGASKWYRSGGSPASQTIALTLAEGAALEWLPQETIVFNGADARLDLSIHCAPAARCVGWDMLVLGRRAAGESFDSGSLSQRISLFDEGRLVWRERAWLMGGDALLQSAAGWDGAHAGGVMWAYGTPFPDALVDACRALGDGEVRFGCTRIDDKLLLVRALAHSPERLRALFSRIWCTLRPPLLARAAHLPRIWAT